jgi:GntR family transcriptional regulator, rspAB operon transcriptional repressor
MTTRNLIRGLREQIVDRLRNDILSGQLAAGTPLREAGLSHRFRVSRGPIREALQQLTHEGVVVAEPNRGVRVAPAAPDSIRELVVPIRRTIEVYALRLFIDTISDNDRALWEEHLRLLKVACERGDYAAIAEQDLALHRSFLQRAGQQDLLAIWSVLVARVRCHFRENSLTYDDPMTIYAEHRTLIDAIGQGDTEAAVKELQEHIT